MNPHCPWARLWWMEHQRGKWDTPADATSYFLQTHVYYTLADPAMPISPTYVAAGYPLCKPFVNPLYPLCEPFVPPLYPLRTPKLLTPLGATMPMYSPAYKRNNMQFWSYFFLLFLSLWIYLWLAETSQQPISQTAWLEVTPHCNHCNHLVIPGIMALQNHAASGPRHAHEGSKNMKIVHVRKKYPLNTAKIAH